MENSRIAIRSCKVKAGIAEVPKFDDEAVIKATRSDQSGESTFLEFLNAIWNAGAWGYGVDFTKRTVTYMGAKGELYTETYPEFEIVVEIG